MKSYLPAKDVYTNYSPAQIARTFPVDAKRGRVYRLNGQEVKGSVCNKDTRAFVLLSFALDGYTIRLARSIYVWAVTNGRWPYKGEQVDHKDIEETTDDRIENLQCVPTHVNQARRRVSKRNRLGVLGIRRTRNGKFNARYFVQGVEYSKTFDNIVAASAWRAAGKRAIFGDLMCQND